MIDATNTCTLMFFCTFKNLINSILKPTSTSKCERVKERLPALHAVFNCDDRISKYVEKTYNEPQALAIRSTLVDITENLQQSGACFPFTLIQGPPGTGKTYTAVSHVFIYQKNFINAMNEKERDIKYDSSTYISKVFSIHPFNGF